ncbi:glycosyltransferase [Streptomyces xanthophaeus]|uniref:glycosyltransferase n=1 Tax=Streptomyces xanthophaeus TaxID=67385 RepID=UPI0038677CE5|nr:glycosyltransferase [Streptomyces xanthophaeus]WST59237.1 glycosyltransferase [Streptomyces xanthophaeus]
MSTTQRPVLFVSLPESGLVNPLLVLAAELSRRRVPDLWFATDEPRRADVERLTEGSAVEFASLGEVFSELSAVSWPDEVYREVTQSSRFKAHRAVIRQSYRPELQAEKFRRLDSLVEKINPTLMVIDCVASFGIDVALTRNIPYVLSVPFLPTNVLTSLNPFGPSGTPRDFPVPHSGLPYPMNFRQRLRNELFKYRTLGMFFHPAMGKVLSEDARMRKELGLPKPNPMTRIDRAELVLCNSVAELDYPFTVPDRMNLVGAMVPPLPEAPRGEDDGGLADWLDARSSVVYMGFGTITRLTRGQVTSLVEVARRMQDRHQFLWRLPIEQQHLLPAAETLPGNLRIEGWLPSQLDVLAHPNVRLFFTHGGGNGFNEGMYFGKPMVVRPLWVDCYDQAVRGQDLGLSLTLDRPREVDPDDVVDKLTRVLNDPRYRERAERIAVFHRAAGGRRTAADLLLGLPALS